MRPMFLEAEILSQLDALDATILKFTLPPPKWSRANLPTGSGRWNNRKLFNHGRTTTEHKVNLGE